jgi:hypothetical protein
MMDRSENGRDKRLRRIGEKDYVTSLVESLPTIVMAGNRVI